MEALKRLIRKINEDIIIKSILLAVCLIFALVIFTQLLLGVITRHGERHIVPDFTDMSISKAKASSDDIDLVLEIVDSLYVPSKGKGVILDQYPKPGSFVKKGRRIFITTNSFTAKVVPMPYVTGFSLRQAKNKIVGSGFVIDKITYQKDLATNNVLKQTYKGKQVSSNNSITGEVGSGVELVVGLNPADAEPTVPLVVGLSLYDAKNKLWESGFNIGLIEYSSEVDDKEASNLKVVSQSIKGGFSAMYGRYIALTLTSDNKKVAESLESSAKELDKYIKEKEALEKLEKEANMSTSSESSATDEEIEAAFEAEFNKSLENQD